LIEALKAELRRPTPLITGTYGKSLVPRAIDVKEQSVKAYTKQRKNWEVPFAPKPHLIRLPLPESALEGDQYLNYYRTFVKDRPPTNFAKHRAICREKSPTATPKRRPFNTLANLALGLMVLDCQDIPKLQRWLLKQTSVLTNLGIRETESKITKRLYNAVQSLQKLRA
jgi:hypothetical protein